MNKTEKIRLINLGSIDWYKTQTIYHAVAELIKEDSTDTIILCKPKSRYLCTGYHQDYKNIFDVKYCKENKIPIIHRKIGGGATYLDSNQLFYQFIFKQNSLPKVFSEIFNYLLSVPKLTLSNLGIECNLTSTNELEIGVRRIAGTGGGFINDACVVVGNFLFDFDFEAMTNFWNLPIENSKIIAEKSLRESLITLNEIDSSLSLEKVEQSFIETLSKYFSCEISVGELTKDEINLSEKLKSDMIIDLGNEENSDSAFIDKPLKISANSNIFFHEFKIQGNIYKFAFYTNKKIIIDLVTEPEFPTLEKLKKVLIGKNILEAQNALSYFQMKFRTTLA